MKRPLGNLFQPATGEGETFHSLLRDPAFLLEHIVSRGAATPAGNW